MEVYLQEVAAALFYPSLPTHVRHRVIEATCHFPRVREPFNKQPPVRGTIFLWRPGTPFGQLTGRLATVFDIGDGKVRTAVHLSAQGQTSLCHDKGPMWMLASKQLQVDKPLARCLKECELLSRGAFVFQGDADLRKAAESTHGLRN